MRLRTTLGRVTSAVAVVAVVVVVAAEGHAVGASLKRCGREFAPNHYSAHIYARSLSCPRARAVWHRYLSLVRHNAIARRAFETPYFHDGPPFQVGPFTCRYRPHGLGGSEFDLRCHRRTAYVLVQRFQDA